MAARTGAAPLWRGRWKWGQKPGKDTNSWSNAGVTSWCSMGDDFDPEAYRRAMRINLDGVVNGAAYRAVVAGRIFDYVRDERIGYLIESPLSLRFRAVQSPGSPPPLLRPLHVEASYPEARARGNPVVVYEVESRVDENGGRE